MTFFLSKKSPLYLIWFISKKKPLYLISLQIYWSIKQIIYTRDFFNSNNTKALGFEKLFNHFKVFFHPHYKYFTKKIFSLCWISIWKVKIYYVFPIFEKNIPKMYDNEDISVMLAQQKTVSVFKNGKLQLIQTSWKF